MKKENNFWVDENGNKWDCDLFTESQAIKNSETLVNCSDCKGCSDCRGCSDCSDCSDCSYCSYCKGCSDCSDCSYCKGCSDCRGCSDCSDCSGCRGCRYCKGCSDCSYCSLCRGCRYCLKLKEWIGDPRRFYSVVTESVNEMAVMYFNEKEQQFVYGCFNGTLIEFETKVKEKYPDTENKIRMDFDLFIKQCKAIIQ